MDTSNVKLLYLLTTSEAASRLGVTAERLRQLVKKGEVAVVRTPYGNLFEPDEVERLRTQRAS